MTTEPEQVEILINDGGIGEEVTEGEAIGSPKWDEKVKAYGSLLIEALNHGVETLQDLLKPWSEHERWGAFLSFEEQSPEAMVKLMQIAPNWSDFCIEW